MKATEDNLRNKLTQPQQGTNDNLNKEPRENINRELTRKQTQ